MSSVTVCSKCSGSGENEEKEQTCAIRSEGRNRWETLLEFKFLKT